MLFRTKKIQAFTSDFIVMGLSCLLMVRSEGDHFAIPLKLVIALLSLMLVKKQLSKSTLPASNPDRSICPMKSLFTSGFYKPESITVATGLDPAILIASSGAGLLQMLHPEVVWMIEKNGKYYSHPQKRIEGTFLFGLSVNYGDQKMADAAFSKFKYLHDHLKTTNPSTGETYSASRTDLFAWVHNSLVWLMLKAFEIYGPKLSSDQQNQFISEQHTFALKIGIEKNDLPCSMPELSSYIKNMQQKLKLTPEAIKFKNFHLNKKSNQNFLVNIIEFIISRAGINLMSTEQKQLFGFNYTSLQQGSIHLAAKAILALMRLAKPANKLLPQVQTELTKKSF